jgi:hypothetical protein
MLVYEGENILGNTLCFCIQSRIKRIDFSILLILVLEVLYVDIYGVISVWLVAEEDSTRLSEK